MKDYIIQSKIKMEKISEIIMQYKQNQKPIYIWGISSDFFIAASFTDLFKCNIIGLIDRNTDKQQLSWKNMKIFSHNILKNLDKNDTVFIFSVYNSNVMRQYLYNLHIDCDIIDIVDILN
jgi:hypothetical protein